LRHGVTTVMLGSCSLSTIYLGGADAGDIFGRVEAIPREHVIAAIDEHKTWTNAEQYIAALEARPLGPNLAAFIGHSDMRAATMGLDRATQKRQRPTKRGQAQMERMLSEALRAGFVGMSSQQLLFDKLDGETCRSRTLPSTYAKPRELRLLNPCCGAPAGSCSRAPTLRTRSTSAHRSPSRWASSATRSRPASCRPPTSRPTRTPSGPWGRRRG
jgi:N-acyl-D-aspartate/D-glutamate deacylase